MKYCFKLKSFIILWEKTRKRTSVLMIRSVAEQEITLQILETFKLKFDVKFVSFLEVFFYVLWFCALNEHYKFLLRSYKIISKCSIVPTVTDKNKSILTTAYTPSFPKLNPRQKNPFSFPFNVCSYFSMKEKINFVKICMQISEYLHTLGCQMKYFSNHHKTERDKSFVAENEERKNWIGLNKLCIHAV